MVIGESKGMNTEHRAALSNRAERLYRTGEGSFRGGRCMAPEAAIREATMLIARNEPGTRWTHHIAAADLDPLRCGTAACMALAEALAAFIAGVE